MKQNTWILLKFYGKSECKDSGTSTNPDQDKHTEHHTKAHNIKLLKVNTKKKILKQPEMKNPLCTGKYKNKSMLLIWNDMGEKRMHWSFYNVQENHCQYLILYPDTYFSKM